MFILKVYIPCAASFGDLFEIIFRYYISMISEKLVKYSRSEVSPGGGEVLITRTFY